MKRICAFLLGGIAVLLNGCVPLSELDSMEATLTSHADSLELQLNECRSQAVLLLDRLAAIERENLHLDDQNRLLSARLAEILYADSTEAGTAQTDRVPARTADTPSDTDVPPVADRSAPPAPAAAGTEGGWLKLNASGAPLAFSAAAAPDLDYLRKYQEALRQHQAGKDDLAFMSFQALLHAPANDMADNCLYWMAESEMRSARHESATRLFTAVLGCEPSDKAAAALLGRARARIALDQTPDARGDLEALRIRYPESQEAAQALTILRDLR
ncbi:MAG: hypothetical protein M5R41_09080 [Bacteroidia bacterium]|nr:hypothetical protein [Bacteroidia bacterium]